jgi:hypothetical protein
LTSDPGNPVKLRWGLVFFFFFCSKCIMWWSLVWSV